MPSSKIIKAAATELPPISAFSFHAVSQNAALTPAADVDDDDAAFVPLALFDGSELGARTGLAPPQTAPEPPPEEVPGGFVSDEQRERELQESYQRGLQDGKNLAERGLLNVFKSMRTASEELQQLRERVLRDSEDGLLALVLAVARRVIHQEVVQNRQVVLSVIRAALYNVSSEDEIVIRVHPDDHALLTASQDQALQRELSSFRFTLKSDVTLPPGCCQVETTLGTVDASFEAQLEEVYRRMLEERTSGDGPEPPADKAAE